MRSVTGKQFNGSASSDVYSMANLSRVRSAQEAATWEGGMELAIRPKMVPGMAGICDRKLLQLIHKMLV